MNDYSKNTYGSRFSPTKDCLSKNIKATFSCCEDSFYDVVLEINSNKFFLSVQQIAHQIQEFQVVCVK
jgi:hypothetical protein